jgi:hypothetical protein
LEFNIPSITLVNRKALAKRPFAMWLPIRVPTAATIPVQGIGGDDAFPETSGRESPDRLANTPPGVQRKLSATDPKTTRDSSHGRETVGEIAIPSVNIKHRILALDPQDDSESILTISRMLYAPFGSEMILRK